MNKQQKAAVIDQVASQIEAADAVLAVDYRGLSVKQAVDLRASLRDADANFQVVKNTLTERAADQAGAEHLKPLLEGPTAFAFVNGDVALAAKALARFRRENGILEWKGGQMDGDVLTPDDIEAIARLPAREQLHAQLVGTIASPLNTLVRGLAGLISGLASQLQQIADQGLVGQEAEGRGQRAEGESGGSEPTETESAGADEEPTAPEAAPAEESPAEEATEEAAEEAPSEGSTSEAPGDPVAEAEAAEAAEGETSETENQEGE